MRHKLAIILSGGGMKCGLGAGFLYGLELKYGENLKSFLQLRKMYEKRVKEFLFQKNAKYASITSDFLKRLDKRHELRKPIKPFIILGTSGSAPTALFGVSNQPRLCFNSWKNDLSTKSMVSGIRIHVDYLVDDIIKNSGFDFETFYSSSTECLIPAIDTKNGEIEYFSNRDKYFLENNEKIFEAIRASASMPIFTELQPEIRVKDSTYCDSILTSSAQTHLEKVIEMGATKVLIIDHDPSNGKDIVDRSFDFWLGFQSETFRTKYNELEERANNYVPPKDVKILKLDLPSWSSATTLDNSQETLIKVVDDGFVKASYDRKLFRFLYGTYPNPELSYL